jgi:DivIVA domain-containing protein
MGSVLLVLVVVLVVAALVFGVVALLSGDDPGLSTAEADGRAVPLPGNRPLSEADLGGLRFDTTLRGYRMEQVDRALRRAAYDIGYKDEMIAVLEAEVIALREGREEDAELLRKARESASATSGPATDVELDDGAEVLVIEPGPGLGADAEAEAEEPPDASWETAPPSSRFRKQAADAEEPARGSHG